MLFDLGPFEPDMRCNCVNKVLLSVNSSQRGVSSSAAKINSVLPGESSVQTGHS